MKLAGPTESFALQSVAAGRFATVDDVLSAALLLMQKRFASSDLTEGEDLLIDAAVSEALGKTTP